MSSLLRQTVRAVPLGHGERAVEVKLCSGNLKNLVNGLKEAYKEAGPRLGICTTPDFLLREQRKRKATKKRSAQPPDDGKQSKAGADQGKGKGKGEGSRTIVLYRPVHIKVDRDIVKKGNAKLDLGGATLLVISPGVTIEGFDITGNGRPGLDWGESHALVEVAGRGDLQMLDCSITVTVPTPEGALYPQPSKNCGALLVEEGARATVDRTEFSSSPLGYGVVARDPGTRVLLEECTMSGSYHGNVLACRRARISLVSCTLQSSHEGYGLSALDTGTVAYCKQTTFSRNSRDNVFCGMGARAVLEGCVVQDSQMRSGFKIDGDGSSGYVRELLPAIPLDSLGTAASTFGLESAGKFGLEKEAPVGSKGLGQQGGGGSGGSGGGGGGGGGGFGLNAERPSTSSKGQGKEAVRGGTGAGGGGGFGLDTERPAIDRKDSATSAKEGAGGKRDGAGGGVKAGGEDGGRGGAGTEGGRKGDAGGAAAGEFGLDSEAHPARPQSAASRDLGSRRGSVAQPAAAPKQQDTSRTAKDPTVFNGNREHAVHARWGAWASIRGCRYEVAKEGDKDSKAADTAAKGRALEEADAGVGKVGGPAGSAGSGWVPCLMEGPSTCVVQDPSLGRPEWRYLSASERPWTRRHAHGESLSTVLDRADSVAAREQQRERTARELLAASGA